MLNRLICFFDSWQRGVITLNAATTSTLFQVMWMTLLEYFVLLLGYILELGAEDLGEAIEEEVRVLGLAQHHGICGRGEEYFLHQHVNSVRQQSHKREN